MAELRIAVVAGEASGDILGAGLMAALKARYPQVMFEGIGGELMIAQGLQSQVPMERLSVMGLVEVLGRLPELLRLRKTLIQQWTENPPDLFIGIDAPDFNLALEGGLKAKGVPTVHYVSPSVWAWKKKRIYTIKSAVDLLLTLFPFEAEHYNATAQNIAYVGHPLADKIAAEAQSQSLAREQLGIAATAPLVALLPGSRGSEIKYLSEPFLEAARLLKQKHPDWQFVMPAANQQRFEEIQQRLASFPELSVKLVLKQSRTVMAACDVMLIASGTATLEALLLKKPMVVAYRMASLTYAIFSRMLKTPYVALPNILAGREVVPEILQQAVTPERLAQEVERFMMQDETRNALMSCFDDIAERLTCQADQRAADAIVDLLKARGRL